MLKVCLNGARSDQEHANIPITAAQLAEQARACVAAGANAIHMHPRDVYGAQSLDASSVAMALLAVREACPGIPIGLSTLYSILPDPTQRANAVAAWHVRPDFVSVNFGEPGTDQLCAVLQQHGIGIEAGLYNVESAQAYVASGMLGRCVRVLLEPDGALLSELLAHVRSIEAVLNQAGDRTARLLHSDGPSTWVLIDVARERGYDTRIGLEDVLTMPDGRQAADNASLVKAALDAQQKRTLLLIRHAASQVDPQQPAQSWPLSEDGRASCTALADVLHDFRPTALFSSREPKARQTAEITAGYLGLPTTVRSSLHEHNRSGVEWMGTTAFQDAVQLFFRQPHELVFGLETAEQAGRRFEQAVGTALIAAPHGNLAIVAHGTVITLLAARHNPIDAYQLWSQLRMPAIVALRVPSYTIAWLAPEVI